MSDDNKQLSSDELRAKVIEEYGFDEEIQSEQIDKLVNERLENQKNLSKTIEQKVKYRELGVKSGILDPTTFEPIVSNEKKPDGELKKTNEETQLTREEAIFFAKGGDVEDLDFAKKVAQLEGISLLAAMESDFYTQRVNSRKAEEQRKNNSIGSSNGGVVVGHAQKPIGQMTDAEHKAFFKKRVGLG